MGVADLIASRPGLPHAGGRALAELGQRFYSSRNLACSTAKRA